MSTILHFSIATRAHVPQLVAMLADDVLGAKRERCEDPLPEAYYKAFDAIDKDPNHELIIAVMNDQLVGFLQLTFLPYLTYVGRWRALIEGVRVSGTYRGKGIGGALLEEAICRAEAKNCHVVQLTTDKARPEALAFYESLGFRASHEGMKLHL